MRTFYLRVPGASRRSLLALTAVVGAVLLLLVLRADQLLFPNLRHILHGADREMSGPDGELRSGRYAVDANLTTAAFGLGGDDQKVTGRIDVSLTWNDSRSAMRGRQNNSHVSPPTNLKATPSPGSGLWVEVPVTGQLGNRMFQYASLLGIARMNGRTPYYGMSSSLDHTFTVSHLSDQRHRDYTIISEKHFASYDPKFQRLPEVNVLCMQYLQSWKYFHFMQADIRQEFTFRHHTRQAAAQLLRRQERLMGNRTRVGVHVRRGDMLRASEVIKGYHTAPASYISKAMDYMRHKYGDVIFLVVTEDAGWCRSELKQGDYVIVGGASAEVHMAVLASCNHVIMTVGTFGWWGGYLAGGEVVYWWDPKESLHDPPLPVEITKPKDFYLPEWIPLTG